MGSDKVLDKVPDKVLAEGDRAVVGGAQDSDNLVENLIENLVDGGWRMRSDKVQDKVQDKARSVAQQEGVG